MGTAFLQVFFPCCLVQDISVLQDQEHIKQLGHILKTNVRACTAVGHPFMIQVSLVLGAYYGPVVILVVLFLVMEKVLLCIYLFSFSICCLISNPQLLDCQHQFLF